MKKRHLRQLPYEHVVVCVVGARLEQNVSSIVLEALRADRGGGKGDAPERLDGVEGELSEVSKRCSRGIRQCYLSDLHCGHHALLQFTGGGGSNEDIGPFMSTREV